MIAATSSRTVSTLPEYLRDIYRAFPLDLAQYNEAEPWTPPMPGRFVIDRTGVVRALRKVAG